MLEHVNVVVLILSRLQERFNTCLELLVQLADDLISARVVIVDRLLGVVELGSRVNRSDSESADCRHLDALKEVGLFAGEHPHAIDLVH